MEKTGDITHLLHKWREGSREAENELFTRVTPNLRRLARYLMKGERKGHSLQPTELVDQIYFRMVAAKDRDWRNRQHFYAIASRAMRRYLIDHARGRPEGGQGRCPAPAACVRMGLADRSSVQSTAGVPKGRCSYGWGE